MLKNPSKFIKFKKYFVDSKDPNGYFEPQNHETLNGKSNILGFYGFMCSVSYSEKTVDNFSGIRLGREMPFE